MKRMILIVTLAVVLAAVPALAGNVFPDLELNGTLTPEQSVHLGVESTPVLVSAIPAKYLFIEVFSMYCPICQRDAPVVNEMRRAIMAADPEGRVRFLGIGAGNTPFEVNFYAKKYAVEFPLFHDQDFIAHKALNNVGTPAFYLVDLKSGREILFFHEGEAKDPGIMVETILKAIRE